MTRYLTWAWMIVVGALLITPDGVWCIACGQPVQAGTYIGRLGTYLVGIITIVTGAYHIINQVTAGTVARKR